MNEKTKSWAITIGVGILIWLCPAPQGITPVAWRTFAVFVAMIAGFIVHPAPMGALSIIAIALCPLLGIAKLSEMLNGFASTTVWICVIAFMLASGFKRTGLGQRVALILIEKFGTSSLRLGYLLSLADLFFAPATPSNTARGGGIIYPLIISISEVFDSRPGPTARRIGAYLIQVEYQVCIITSAMFMTGMIAGPMIPAFAKSIVGVEITWMSWAIAAIVPGLLSIAAFPYIWYKIYPPEIKETPQAREMAREKLIELGPMKGSEKTMLATFAGCLLLWATSGWTKLDATHVAFIGLSVLLFAGVLDWKNCLDEGQGWDSMVWIGTLIVMANLLAKHGLVKYFSTAISASLSGMSWPIILGILVLAYLYVHYFFAALSSHVTAMYPAFIAVGVATGVPAELVCIVLAFWSSLCSSLTHYGGGMAPILFGSGYVDQGTWWKLGFVASLVNLVIWCGAGGAWLKVLGYW